MTKRHIATFSDGTSCFFEQGAFDDFCVYVEDTNSAAVPPRDVDYFSDLISLGKHKGFDFVYSDFVVLYARTGTDVLPQVISDIKEKASEYPPMHLVFEKTFTVLYAGMIAEENKVNTKLGKRIKRLGVHSLLVERIPVEQAANFMRGMPWRQIDELCKARGF